MVRHALRADDWARLCRRGPRLVAQTRQFLQRGEGPHHARDGIAVGDGDGGKPEFRRAGHKLFGMRGAAQEGEVGGDAKLGIGGHRNTPCTYHSPNPEAACGVRNSQSRGPSRVSIRQ